MTPPTLYPFDEDEISESFVRASGPGGQNVNKVCSAVELRFDAAASLSFPEEVRDRLIQLAGSRATKDGVIILLAQTFRTQERNRQDARERLQSLINRASVPPPPPRKKTRPSRAAREKRLEGKAIRSTVKKLRGRVGED